MRIDAALALRSACLQKTLPFIFIILSEFCLQCKFWPLQVLKPQRRFIVHPMCATSFDMEDFAIFKVNSKIKAKFLLYSSQYQFGVASWRINDLEKNPSQNNGILQWFEDCNLFCSKAALLISQDNILSVAMSSICVVSLYEGF